MVERKANILNKIISIQSDLRRFRIKTSKEMSLQNYSLLAFNEINFESKKKQTQKPKQRDTQNNKKMSKAVTEQREPTSCYII